MSYRSFKRVLGETSLERKCRYLFGACLLSLITASFWWYSTQTEVQVYQASQRTGRGLVDLAILRKHWEWDMRGQDKDFKTAEHYLPDLKPQHYNATFLMPSWPDGNQPKDPFEWGLVKKWEGARKDDDGPTLFDDRRRIEDGKYVYEYYQPVYAKEACIYCHISWDTSRFHRNVDWKAGDLMSIAKVDFSDHETQEALNENRAFLLATGFITVFLAMVASYLIVRYVIVKPLKHLRDVSDTISRGDTSLRADIHTGDEFEELGIAFNRMVRHLTDAQRELQQANVNLDQKVDELAQVNMQLYETNRLKSDFLATMSHELRTPLNAIIGFSDVLGAISSLDEKQKRYVKNIQTSGKSLLEMINDILDLAKIESGKMEVRLSDFDIGLVVCGLCDVDRPLAERKNIDLETEIEPGLPPLFQDQGKVQQILNNLLSNAIKFTPEGGRIVVAVRRAPNGDLLMAVADTGVGIAEEDQTAIFEKFRQGKSALSGGDAMTREYSGTGLGLSIVKELCKLLGGEVTLVSELGRGSTFTVQLPWTRADQPTSDGAFSPGLDELLRPKRGEHPITSPVGAAMQ